MRYAITGSVEDQALATDVEQEFALTLEENLVA